MRRLVLAVAMSLGACRQNSSQCPPPIASTTSARTVPEPRVGTLTRSPATSIDLAPGPDGRAYVAAIVQERGRGHVRAMEWDVGKSRVVDGSEREIVLSDEVDLGNPSDVRIASAGDRAFVTVETENGQTLMVVGLRGGRSGFDQARDASLAVDEEHVVVAYHPVRYGVAQPPTLAIHVFDTALRAEIAKVELPSGAVRGVRRGERHQALAMAGRRLYLARRDPAWGPRVTELELPSLRPLTHFVAAEREPESEGRPLKLATNGSHLFLLHAGRVVELTADLAVVRVRALDTDEIAPSPSGALLTSTGLAAAGRRFEPVAAVGRDASCTPAWIGDAPLLACAVDLDASRIARLR